MRRPIAGYGCGLQSSYVLRDGAFLALKVTRESGVSGIVGGRCEVFKLVMGLHYQCMSLREDLDLVVRRG